MKQKLQLTTLFILSLLIVTSCTPTPNRVASLPISGFGGTGYKPSGFGGTGIVGTITQFGSIWVNNVEIDYDKNIQVTSNLLAKDTLKIGKQVVLETLQDDNKIETKKVTIYYPIAGKITDLTKKELTLNNNLIIKTNHTKIGEDVQLKVGEYVAINGFEVSAKTWVATRISRNPQYKVFYQDIPDLKFSKYVKKVLIESSASQLKKWNSINTNTNSNIFNNLNRIIITGRIDNHGNVHLNTIQSYNSFKGLQKRRRHHPTRQNIKRINNRGRSNHMRGFNQGSLSRQSGGRNHSNKH